MSSSVPRCRVGAEVKAWIEKSMLWLIEEFGRDALLNATVVLPTDEFFPDQFSEDEEGARALVERVCGYMGVDPERVELEFFTDENAAPRPGLPFDEFSRGGVAGHYRKRR